MFEKVVESILVEYLSEWVEGLDPEKMKIAIFGGKVEVRELKLKAAALDQFQLPLRIKQGTIGRLSMKVPWKRLTTQAVKIVLEDIVLLVVPSHHDDLRVEEMEDSYAMRIRFAKQQEIRVRELYEKCKEEEGETLNTSTWGYRDKILNNILDNVSFEMKNIHLRYEDTTQFLTTRAFGMGLTIEAIHVNTTNANGYVTFIDRAQSHTPFIHKMLEIFQLGFYVDDTAPCIQDLVTTRRLKPPLSTYILHPFNIHGKMTVNHEEATMTSIPKYQFVTNVGSILASITQGQCNALVSVVNFISTHEMYLKRIHIRKQRPKTPLKRDPRSWWKYAVYGVQVLYNIEGMKRLYPSIRTKPICTWKRFAHLWMIRKQYMGLYKKMRRTLVKKGNGSNADIAAMEMMLLLDKAHMDELEDELDVETIIFYRLCAEQEYEMEENRPETIKKTGWKARFKSNDKKEGLRLDVREKMQLYLTISEQMNISSSVIAAREQRAKNSKAILYGLQFVATSFTFSLVEPTNQVFVRFELNQFGFAMMQRANGCIIASSIRSIQMLDCSGQDGIPQPLFYTLTQPSSHLETEEGMISVDTKFDASHFMGIRIDSSETKLQVQCTFQPFRYIHNLKVAAKLRTYFVIQVEVAPEVKENAEEALANSSVWLNHAVFAGVPSSKPRSNSKGENVTVSPIPRIVEFSVILPEVDLFVLSSETSPILQARWTELSFQTQNLSDAFEFSTKGVEILFIDGVAVASSPHTTLARTSSYYQLKDRKHSTILRKTRVIFTGKQVKDVQTATGRPLEPKWMMECTAPPIYLNLTSAQYQQVVHAAAAWVETGEGVQSSSTKSKPVATPSTSVVQEFDPDDERFGFCVHIPQILVVLEGGGGTGNEAPSNSTDVNTGIDLVLDIRSVNIEAKFTSVAQAIVVDCCTLDFFKRTSRPSKKIDGGTKKVKLTTAEAIAQNEEDAPSSRTSSLNNQPEEPDPAYDPQTGVATKKLVEIGQKVTLMISSVNPFKGKLKAQQIVVYWDHDLLVTLFRSYLWGSSTIGIINGMENSPSSSTTSSVSESRTSSGRNALDTVANDVPSAEAITSALIKKQEPQASSYCFEFVVERWFLFMRPQGTQSQRFALKLYGRDLSINTTTMRTWYPITTIHSKNGIFLESSRFVSQQQSDEICELFRAPKPLQITMESGGYHSLSHREGASAYTCIRTSQIHVNFVQAHFQVLLEHVTKQLIGFIGWVSLQFKPHDVKSVNGRSKLDAVIDGVTIHFPRGPVGNTIERAKKPEHLTVEIQRIGVTSRAYPANTRVEQLLFRADEIVVASMITESSRVHTNAVASVDEAVVRAERNAAQQAQDYTLALSKARIFHQDTLYVEFTSVPIPPKVKKTTKSPDSTTLKRPLDMDDVTKEMENYCSVYRMYVTPPLDWKDSCRDISKPCLTIATGKPMIIAVDQQQLELLLCILDENFSHPELQRRTVSLQQEEKLQMDLSLSMGDVCLNLLRPSLCEDEDISDRVVARIDLEDVRMMMLEYSSYRGQQRILASKARYWKTEMILNKDRMERREMECGEMYLSSQGDACQCIDVTVDHHAPIENTPPMPQDVRVHVDTCAFMPSFLSFADQLKPFIGCKPKFPYYVAKQGSPMNISFSTGIVHLMVARHSPPPSQEDGDEEITLNLVVTGCLVLRSTEINSEMRHIQFFGRKMSAEVTSCWPPLPVDTDMVPPSPCALLSSSPSRKKGLSIRTPIHRPSLKNYRRVLCDDFTIDMDVMDSSQVDQTIKLTTSLTHFHAVLCTFDLFMLSQVGKNSENHSGSSSETPKQPTSQEGTVDMELSSRKFLITVTLEDIGLTLVREIGEYFSPLARAYTNCMICDVSLDVPMASKTPTVQPPTLAEMTWRFTEENSSCVELQEDEGLSLWAFNAVLGSWEPMIEPWTFVFKVALETTSQDEAGRKKMAITCDLNGSDAHSLNLNFSPSLLETCCAITKELDVLTKSRGGIVPVSTASVISCGFYLANDSGATLSYWVSDVEPTTRSTSSGSTVLTHASRGFTYAPKHKRVIDVLLPRHKVPLKLSTAILTSLPNDQTLSFNWDNEEYHPLTDVRIHSVGKYVYSVLPKSNSRTSSRTDSSSSTTPSKVLFALFDISTVFGYRTLTVSSLIRVFNDTDCIMTCAILGDDGKTITEIGVIEPHDVCGVPITMIRSIASIRLLVRPDESLRPHRWSNELFINEKEEKTETIAACSLILDDYECRCQRMFDGSQPLHTSQICQSNGSFFRIWNRVLTASNTSGLKYAQIHILPSLLIENKCGTTLYMMIFVFKKVRRMDGEREYSHIVASEKIVPYSTSYCHATSLNEQTYGTISMTGFSWSKLFLLSSSSSQEILCSLQDFQSRKASILVSLQGPTSENAIRRVIIQPRFEIRNDTNLSLLFEPQIKVKQAVPLYSPPSKSLFSSISSTISPTARRSSITTTCCGTSQLEAIHSKLNAFHGVTTTSNDPKKTEDKESLYCSDTHLVNIQIEGNVLGTSGITMFRLDTAVGGSNNTIRLYDESTKQWHDLVVILKQVDAITTKATFVERYMMVNHTEWKLVCAPMSEITLQSSHIVLEPHLSSPFHWSTKSIVPTDSCVRLKLYDSTTTGWQWCGKFSLHDVSETAFKLYNQYTHQVHVIRVEVRVESSVRVFVMITNEDQAVFPLYRIINTCHQEIIHFKQVLNQVEEIQDINHSIRQRLFPGETIRFGWDEGYFLPTMERVIELSYASNSQTTKVCFDQPGEAQRVDFPSLNGKQSCSIWIHWYLNGVTKTIHIHDTSLPRDKHTGKLMTMNSNPSILSILTFHTRLSHLLVSIINQIPEEMVLLTFKQVDLRYANHMNEHDECEVQIGFCQVDNQLVNAVFPVLFTPMPSLEQTLFFHASVFRLTYGDGVEYIQYLSAMMQPARFQIDDFLIFSIALFISNCNTILPLQQLQDDTERRMYIETLQLHPMKLYISFQQNTWNTTALYQDVHSWLPLIYMILKSNLINIEDAILTLNALHIDHSFTTRSFMWSAIQQHYAFQGLFQMYALIGAADILGNPLRLVNNLGTGVKDFFYEPMAGMVKSPQEFVMGLSRGTASLVKHSVAGTFNAASKFTGTLSSGIAALSMDSEYIKARNTRNHQEKATHIGTGLYYGTKQLGQGIFDGVSGVITAPAMGAYHNGLTGFVEGVGKGLIGVAVKPTAGILDLAAKTTAGITATATVFDKKARDTRMRLPRMMYTSDKRLRVYSSDEAMISQLLTRLPQKLLSNEHYEAHVLLPTHRAIIASSHQIFHVDYSSIAGVTSIQPRVTWKFSLNLLWGTQKVVKGVNIIFGSTSKGTIPTPLSPTTADKNNMTIITIPLQDTGIIERLIQCIADLVAKQRQRAPISGTISAPLPRNSIGMVLEPIRDSNKVAGYEGYGGRVVEVFVGSACFRAGVEVGDIIVGFARTKFEAGDHGGALRTQLSMMKKGDTLDLMVLRQGVIKEIKVITE